MSTSSDTNLTTLLRQQESLRGIIESISSELELRPLLTLIVRHACELLGAANGTMGLVDEQRQVVVTEAIYQMPQAELGAEFPAGVGLFGQLLLQPKPIMLDRYGDIEQPTQPDLVEHCVLGLPILWRDQMIGVFGLGSPPPRQFSAQDAEILSLFAKHAAIAIINARLFESERQRTARGVVINQINRQINSSLSLDLILQTAVKAINEHLDYPNVALLLIDPEDPNLLVLRASSGVYTAPDDIGYRQPIDVGIIGAAAQSRQPILIKDVRREARYLPVPGADDILSELAIPLVVGDRLLGVLNIEAKRTITQDNVTGLQIVADQLGVAIDNAHHYAEEKRRTERLELIARVGQRIAARLDPDELFTTTIEELYAQLGYDHVAIFLVDPVDPAWLVQRARASRWQPGEAKGFRLAIGQGIVGAAARQRTVEIVNDVPADPRYVQIPGAAALRAEMAVPILLGEHLLGVVDVASHKPFFADDVKAIQIISDQFAVAIDHAYLFADTQQTLIETELLYATSQRISLALDVADVIQVYLEQVAMRRRYACTVALYEFDEASQRSAVLARGHWSPQNGLLCPLMERLPYTQDALDVTLDEGQTVTISNVHADARVSPALRKLQAQDGRPALAMIPLIARGQRIGLVILSYPDPHEWQAATLHPYQITAAQLATAIDSRLQLALVAKHDQQLAVLEERRRLARELHDSVTQLIFSMTLIAQSIGPAWRRNPSEGEQRLQRLLELSQATLAEMRALLVELRPAEPSTHLHYTPPILLVQQQGLALALGHHAAEVGRDGLRIDLETSGYVRQPTRQEECLFRIAQEAFNNIVKHAQASQVTLQLVTRAGATYLTIQDNGKGFVLAPMAAPSGALSMAKSAPKFGSGLGLQNMRERAEALAGQLHIFTAPGQGTRIEVVLPT